MTRNKHLTHNHQSTHARTPEKMSKPPWGGTSAQREAYKNSSNAKRRRQDKGMK